MWLAGSLREKTLKTEARRRHRKGMAAQMSPSRSLAVVRKLKKCVSARVLIQDRRRPFRWHVGGPGPQIKCACSEWVR